MEGNGLSSTLEAGQEISHPTLCNSVPIFCAVVWLLHHLDHTSRDGVTTLSYLVTVNSSEKAISDAQPFLCVAHKY